MGNDEVVLYVGLAIITAVSLYFVFGPVRHSLRAILSSFLHFLWGKCQSSCGGDGGAHFCAQETFGKYPSLSTTQKRRPPSPLRGTSPIKNGGRRVLVFLMLGVALFCTNAAAKSEPAVSGVWQLSCLTAYQDIVSTMNPDWIPDQLRNGFEVIEGTEATHEVRLGGSPTVPWLTIYNSNLKPIYHAVGFNSRSDELWQLVIDQNIPTDFAPKLYEIEPYTGVRAADLPDADFTFVEYEAKWSTNCKLVQGAMADFVASHPNLKISHVQIEADTAKMQKKKYTSQTCPVTT